MHCPGRGEGWVSVMGRAKALSADLELLARQLAEVEGLSLREIGVRLGVGKDVVARTLRPARAAAQVQVRRNEVVREAQVVATPTIGVADQPVRQIGRNELGEAVYARPDGTVVSVGSTSAVRWVRVADAIATVPPWGRVLHAGWLVGVSADGRLLCPHCSRWRSLAEVTEDPGNTCVGVTARPGALFPVSGEFRGSGGGGGWWW